MKTRALLCLLGLAMLVGCSFNLEPKNEPVRIETEGLANAYVSLGGIHPYDGTILEANVLAHNRGRHGEIVSFEAWPFVGVGVGLVGVRVQVLPLEVAAGVLFYCPTVVEWKAEAKPVNLEVKIEEPSK